MKEKEELQREIDILEKQGKEKEAKELELQLYSIADHWDDVNAYSGSWRNMLIVPSL